jgi:hypothetical protein
MLSPESGEINRPNQNLEAWFTPGRFAIFLALLILAAFPDVVFGQRTFFYRDFGIFGYPLAHYHRESFWRGEFPLWNPLNNCGLPFLAQWNTLACYPLSLLYLLLPLSWSLGIFCLLHQFLAGFGMYFLARQWTGNRFAASVAGIAFAFTGLILSSLKWPNNIAALGWMPWVVWLVERGWREGGRSLVLAAGVGTLQMLTGGPEIILFTWAFLAVLWLAEMYRSVRAGLITHKSCSDGARGPQESPAPLPPAHEPHAVASVCDRRSHHQPFSGAHRDTATVAAPRRAAFRFFVIAALVAGLASVQLLPFLDLLTHSQRDTGYSDASWAMPLWGWANFLVPLFRCFPSHQGVFAQPDQYWISSYYAGIGVLALAGLALRHLRRSRSASTDATSGYCLLLFIIVSFSLILALGPEGYLYGWLKKAVPGMQIIRFPIKFVVLAAFAFPLLAALAVAQLAFARTHRQGAPEVSAPLCQPPAIRHRLRMMDMIAGAFVVLVGLILWFAKTHPLPADSWTATWQSGLSRLAFLALTLAAITALTRVTRAPRQALFGWSLLLIIWLDALTHAPRLNPTIEPWVYKPELAKAELKLNPEPRLGQSRAMISPYAEFRLNHLALTNAVEDYLYSRMSQFANANLLGNIPKVDGFYSLYLREENRVRSMLYAATNISFPNMMDFLGVTQITAPGKLIEWSARTNSLALASGGQQPVFADESTTLRALAEPSFDPRRVVFLPLEAQGQVFTTNAAQATVAMKRFAAHHIELDVESTTPTWVVIAQASYHPWRASVNGQAARLWPANHAFQAVEVPAGRSTFKLVYRDAAFNLGMAISGLALCVCLWLWFRGKTPLIKSKDEPADSA